MKELEIYNLWTNFITDIKYSKYFRTKQVWDYSFTIMKEFIDKKKDYQSGNLLIKMK